MAKKRKIIDFSTRFFSERDRRLYYGWRVGEPYCNKNNNKKQGRGKLGGKG